VPLLSPSPRPGSYPGSWATLELEPGTMLDQYRVDRAVGRGGMGVVYAAWDTANQRRVAVKVLSGGAFDPGRGARFRREAATVARLNHPGIVELYGVGETATGPYIAMRWVEGTTLRGWLAAVPRAAAGGPAEDVPTARTEVRPVWEPERSDTRPRSELPTDPDHTRRAVRVFRELVAAVAHAHAHGVVHRDLKPENVMVEPDGRVVVIDFGLARGKTDPTLTSHNGLVGTPRYMAPEQLLGARSGPAADVYALGLIGYELLALALPYRGRAAQEVIAETLHAALPPLTGRNPAVPAALANVIHRATAKLPEERYADAGELLADLDRYLAGSRVSAARYAYRFEAPDLFAARPRVIALASRVDFALGTFVCLIMALTIGVPAPSATTAVVTLGLLTGGGLLAVAWLIAGGHRGARTAARVACAVLALSAARNLAVNGVPGTVAAVFQLALAGLNVCAVQSRAGRDWIARVQQKRREFEAERRGTA